MTTDPEFVEFVRGYIRTVWAVELLLLLMRESERYWTAGELESELRGNHYLVTDILSRFAAGGLVMSDEIGGYRYAPASSPMEDLCRELESAYRERPVAVVNIIATSPSPLESLAHAFKFRGKD